MLLLTTVDKFGKKIATKIYKKKLEPSRIVMKTLHKTNEYCTVKNISKVKMTGTNKENVTFQE
jgi:hypothetical protein